MPPKHNPRRPPDFAPTGLAPRDYVKKACEAAARFGVACDKVYLKTLMAISAADVAAGGMPDEGVKSRQQPCDKQDMEIPLVRSICKAGCKAGKDTCA